MVQTLEDIKSGGGSIRVGTTGTISSLMTRELESVKSVPQTPVVSVACGATSKILQTRKSLDEASTSSSSSNNNCRNPEVARKTKSYTKRSHQVPILGSDNNIMLDRTPNRKKSNKKGPNIVEIVDIKCGQPDRAWANPIANKLKKLGFSKLSESII